MDAAIDARLAPLLGLMDDDRAEERRFRILLAGAVLFAAFVAILVPLLPHPVVPKPTITSLKPHRAKLILPPAPPPPKPVEKPKPKPEPPKPVEKPKPPKPVEKPKPKPKPKVAPKPKPKPKPKPVFKKKPVTAAQAKARAAARADLQALSQDLSALKQNSAVERVAKQRPLKRARDEAPVQRPSVIEAKANEQSKGIDSIEIARDVKSTELENHSLVEVQDENIAAAVEPLPEPPALPTRDLAEIARIIEAEKDRLYILYKRALRQDPDIAGKIVLRITIEPDGKVSKCEVASSDLHATKLEGQIRRRVSHIDFGAEEVETTTTDYAMEFGG